MHLAVCKRRRFGMSRVLAANYRGAARNGNLHARAMTTIVGDDTMSGAACADE
jgi:hypothetical protein